MECLSIQWQINLFVLNNPLQTIGIWCCLAGRCAFLIVKNASTPLPHPPTMLSSSPFLMCWWLGCGRAQTCFLSSWQLIALHDKVKMVPKLVSFFSSSVPSVVYENKRPVCPDWRLQWKVEKWHAVAHTFNPPTWEAEAGRALWVRGQPGLESENLPQTIAATQNP